MNAPVSALCECGSGLRAVRCCNLQLGSLPPAGATRHLVPLVERALQAHQPPLVRGRRIKLRYAHQGGRNPPRIVIHGNQTSAVPEAYTRYLANVFRKAYDLFATPVAIEYRTDANPYQRDKRVRPQVDRQRRKASARRR